MGGTTTVAGNRRSFRSSAPKRRVAWEGAGVDLADVGASGAFQTMITEDQLENFPNPTIVRVRGRVMVLQDATTPADAFGSFAMGLILVTRPAFVANAVPLPFNDIGSDWLWWDVGTIGEESSGGIIGRTISVDRIIVDSKAMRKVKPNTVLVFVAQGLQAEGVNLTANIFGQLRFLMKLA